MRPILMSLEISSLVEAKKIYTNQLCKLLQPQIYRGLAAIWEMCKLSDEPLKQFQLKMEHIPRWNSMIIDDEYQRIVNETKCSYIDKLLDTVFIANAKILSVLNSSKCELDIHVPTPKMFLHYCYINCAYRFYSDPFVFDDRHDDGDYRKKQKNMREITKNIHGAIQDAIENLLPIEDLLETCLTSNKEESFFNAIEGKDETNVEDDAHPKLDVVEGDNLYESKPMFEEEKTDENENEKGEDEEKEDDTEEKESEASDNESVTSSVNEQKNKESFFF